MPLKSPISLGKGMELFHAFKWLGYQLQKAGSKMELTAHAQ
jgi:hypothetical protein